MAGVLEQIIGGNIGELFSKIVGAFKLSPEKAAELEGKKLEAQSALDQMQKQYEARAQEIVATEIQQAAEIIKIEAVSQSWLARNVRPGLLGVWGCTISLNYLVPIFVNAFALIFGSKLEVKPVPVDEWLYYMTALGFTGYVGSRAVEKIMGMKRLFGNGKNGNGNGK